MTRILINNQPTYLLTTFENAFTVDHECTSRIFITEVTCTQHIFHVKPLEKALIPTLYINLNFFTHVTNITSDFLFCLDCSHTVFITETQQTINMSPV